MILINLLPHREEKRRLRKQAFFVMMGICAGAGVVLAAMWLTAVKQMTSVQQSRNEFLNAEIKKLESQIKDIATLRTEIDALKARQKAVEGLQIDRNTPVYLLDELVKQTPEGVYLSSIKQNGQQVLVTGMAQTNERVSEFLRNTLYNSPWLEHPELVEIKAVSQVGANREVRRLSDFSMRLSIKRPLSVAAAASAASASSGAASAAMAKANMPLASPASAAAPLKPAASAPAASGATPTKAS